MCTHRGVGLTALRQATNQGEPRNNKTHYSPISHIRAFTDGIHSVLFSLSLPTCHLLEIYSVMITAANFTAYTELKKALFAYQPQYEGKDLPSWQTAIIGLISGACGPFTNGEWGEFRQFKLIDLGRCRSYKDEQQKS